MHIMSIVFAKYYISVLTGL